MKSLITFENTSFTTKYSNFLSVYLYQNQNFASLKHLKKSTSY